MHPSKIHWWTNDKIMREFRIYLKYPESVEFLQSNILYLVILLLSVCKNAVWNELEKENKEFFEAYSKSQSSEDRMTEAETSKMIRKMISDSSKDSDD